MLTLFVLLLLVLIALGVDIFISLGFAGVLGILLFRGPDALTIAATDLLGTPMFIPYLFLPLGFFLLSLQYCVLLKSGFTPQQKEIGTEQQI